MADSSPESDNIRPEMAITITRSPVIHHQERQAVPRRALVYTARHFGYVWAEEELPWPPRSRRRPRSHPRSP
ncbi:hypothetical protein ABZ468_28225 [Streptomyces sp. NPDC005708]|uniref:hypothetical protein n=1 Tax=Streptomyces sp. NPDC005708 TaxID=3154564 RepID=UPI0033F28B54